MAVEMAVEMAVAVAVAVVAQGLNLLQGKQQRTRDQDQGSP